jgi:predicted GNAT family acetyltransferase
VTTNPQLQPAGAGGGDPVVAVTDNPQASRFELRLNQEFAGYATYRDLRAGRAFEHTVIAAEFEGLGLASTLIRVSLDESRHAERRVLPFCPFVREFIRRHPEYVGLVDDPQRFDVTP